MPTRISKRPCSTQTKWKTTMIQTVPQQCLISVATVWGTTVFFYHKNCQTKNLIFFWGIRTKAMPSWEKYAILNQQKLAGKDLKLSKTGSNWLVADWKNRNYELILTSVAMSDDLLILLLSAQQQELFLYNIKTFLKKEQLYFRAFAVYTVSFFHGKKRLLIFPTCCGLTQHNSH